MANKPTYEELEQRIKKLESHLEENERDIAGKCGKKSIGHLGS